MGSNKTWGLSQSQGLWISWPAAESIINHLYWCISSTTSGDVHLMKAKWLFLDNHIGTFHVKSTKNLSKLQWPSQIFLKFCIWVVFIEKWYHTIFQPLWSCGSIIITSWISAFWTIFGWTCDLFMKLPPLYHIKNRPFFFLNCIKLYVECTQITKH